MAARCRSGGEGLRLTESGHSVVRVGLGARSYEIRVEAGALTGLGPLVARVVGPSAALVVTGSGPVAAYGDQAALSLGQADIRTYCMQIPRGERRKTLRWVGRICERMAEARLDRRSVVVAVGGGVVGDMAGLGAALYMRGVACVQAPTTLLAQVDASVGGKTGVNLRAGKNLIGAFHQPRAVLIDPDTLATLPLRELRAGLAEVIKHGLIRDAGYLETVKRDMRNLLARDPTALQSAIVGSCQIKAAVVEADETEQGARAVLNFGHTIGHAVETIGGYRRFRHGEAVAIGMRAACLVGEEMGITPPNVSEAVEDILRAANLPVNLPADMAPAGVIEAMGTDKKSSGGRPRFVLLREVGWAEPGFDPDVGIVRKALDRAQIV